MSQNDGSYEIEVNSAGDRLFLTLSGMLDGETANVAADEIAEVAEELPEGFDMVNDIAEFKPMSQEATEAIERGKAAIAANGVSAVVRVVGDSVIGKMQFDRVGGEEEGYHVATAESREQAVEFLDEFRERRG